MIELIAFDADDTLWENEILYIQARDRFVRLMARSQTPETTGNTLDEIESKNMQDYGYGIKAYTLSMIETAVQLTGDPVAASLIVAIQDIGKDMHRAAVQLFDHVEAVLAELSLSYRLMLLTKGDAFEQERKIRRSGLVKYFRYIEIVGEKSMESYRFLLEKYRLPASRFMMVGNSIRSDIMPVVAVGGIAVHIPVANTWFHEMVKDWETGKEAYIELEHIGQLPGLIEALTPG
jgi:putative hydrolase of the HAD superfamily